MTVGRIAVVTLSALALTTPAAGAPASPRLTFTVFAHTDQNMDSIVWTGRQFLYVQNTKNTIWSAPPAGAPVAQFATMPQLVEETRCIQSPGTHGWPTAVIFCHSPDDKIYEIPGDGGDATVLATLPVPAGTVSDGALVWDNVGKFGYKLVAATGRSGANQALGGAVYTVDPAGQVQQVGTYEGPGTDEVAIAPAGFGSIAGDVLLGEDGGSVPANLVAMNPSGDVRTVVRLALGINPIIPILPPSNRKASPPPGVYITDDLTGNTYFAPAAQLERYVGDLLVASEAGARFWILVPHGTSFRAIPVRHNALHAKSIEAGIYIR